MQPKKNPETAGVTGALAAHRLLVHLRAVQDCSACKDVAKAHGIRIWKNAFPLTEVHFNQEFHQYSNVILGDVCSGKGLNMCNVAMCNGQRSNGFEQTM